MAQALIAPGIVIDAQLRRGKPTIEGTRITVDEVLAKLEAGQSFADIQEAWPHLTRKQLVDALRFARTLIEAQNVEPARSDAGEWLSGPEWQEL